MNLKRQCQKQEIEIIQALFSDNKVKTQKKQQQNILNSYQINNNLTLTDNVMIMLVKQIEYVETLTGFKNGFLFNQKKMNIYSDTITEDIIPNQYKPLWRFIDTSQLKKCKNIKRFLNKMLASKNMFILKQFFQLYFEALQNILYIEKKFRDKEFTQRQLIQFSRLFGKNLCKRIIFENQYNQFISISQKYVSIALLNRENNIKELEEFQEKFLSMYNTWKIQFSHLIEVIYYCITVQFYDIPVNYLYEGYFKNTQFQTERGVPKFNIKS